MESRRNALLGGIVFFLLVYLSTPFVSQLSLIGIVDSVGAALVVVACCYLLFLVAGRLAVSLVVVFLALIISFNIASGQYFQLQQYYPTVESIYLIKELWSLISAYRIWQIFLLLIAVLAGVVFLYFMVGYARPTSVRAKVFVTVVLSCTSVLLQWGYATSNKNNRFFVVNSSPIGHFIRSMGVLPFVTEDAETAARYERDGVVRGLLKDPEKKLPDKYSVDVVGKLLGYGLDYQDRIDHGKYPLYKRPLPISRQRAKPHNVIVLVLESVRASEMGVYGAAESATPFLDTLASKGTLVKNFYATSSYTVKSEHAINCSALDLMFGNPVAESSGDLKTLCLPELLGAHGYTSLWFHGNESSFYNRKSYLPKLGFDTIYDADALNKDGSMQELGWGISDPEVFARATDILASTDQPFYAEVLTLSNHLPFDYEWGIEFPDYLTKDDTFHDRYRRGIYYTDQAVKQLYNSLKQSGLLENSILVITGDHGIWSFADETLPDLHKNEQLFRVPLIVLAPEIQPVVVAGNHSHLDIAPTVVEYLGLEIKDDFMGQSIFSSNPVKRQRVIYSMSDNAVSYRFEDRFCIPSVQCTNNSACTALHEENIPSTVCYDIPQHRDVLFDGAPIEFSSDAASWQDRALFDYSQIAVEVGSIPAD